MPGHYGHAKKDKKMTPAQKASYLEKKGKKKVKKKAKKR